MRKVTKMMTSENRPLHPRVIVDLENHVILVGKPHSYEIDLETFTSPAQVLDWILQVSSKPWCDRALLGELVAAIETACNEWFDTVAQAVFCPFGEARRVDWLAKKSVPASASRRRQLSKSNVNRKTSP
jgi:hypothetical protein